MSVSATTVRRLRWRGPPANPLAERRRLETALDDATAAVRLAADAVLCVRRMAVSRTRLEGLAYTLATEAGAAARPALGPVPAGANAVLFADRAELLACLARDWCDGGRGWWWPVLYPGQDLAAVARRVWLDDPQPVPEALARLESAGLGARFLQRFAPADLGLLWRNLLARFELGALDGAWDTTRPTSVGAVDPAAPWTPWVEPERSLAGPAARVLVAAVLLVRAPAVVRSVGFARAVRAWSAARAQVSVSSGKMVSWSGTGEPSAETHDVLPANPPTVPAARPWLPVPAAARASAPAAPVKESPCESRSEANLVPSSATAARPDSLPPGSLASVRPASGSSPPASARPGTARLAAPAPDRIETDWGGVWYLVNVALALGWYGDFTMPALPGLTLSLWDFLALIGERMIGAPFIADPLPALLARLAGRGEEEPPGVHFEPPDGEGLDAWLDTACARLCGRLTAALGVTDPAALRALVLAHHARVEATASRVEVRFALAAHPIELRLAGLDRDPGWVPAGGRIIAFHYE